MDRVSYDPKPLPASGHLMGKRSEWPPETAEAVRLVVATMVGEVREELEAAEATILDGMSRDDFQLTVAGLRKILVAGLRAKEVADVMVRWYGAEAAGL